MNTTEFPSNDFKVIPIQDLSVNGNLDPRSQEVANYNGITCKTVEAISKLHNHLSTALNDDEDVPIDQRFIMWGDSDIPYLQQMMSPAKILSSIKKGILFAKIGAKITETYQPLDLGPFFKILKISGRNSTSVGSVSDMTITVDNMFKKLGMKK